MTTPSPTLAIKLKAIGDLLEIDYKEAINANIKYEVQTGSRSKASLEEFEAALSHLSLSFSDKGRFDFHISEAKKHLGRISIEMTEQVVEDLLARIRTRVDPFIKHPFITRVCFISPLSHSDKAFKDIKEIMDLIIKGRRLKGDHGQPMNALDAFKKACDLAMELDNSTYSILLARIWNFLLALCFCVIGVVLTIISQLLVSHYCK